MAPASPYDSAEQAGFAEAKRRRLYIGFGHRCHWREIPDPFSLRPRIAECDACGTRQFIAEPGREG